MNTKLEADSVKKMFDKLIALRAEAQREVAACNDRAKLQKLMHWLQREIDLEGRQHGLWDEMQNLAAERFEGAGATTRGNAEFPGEGLAEGKRSEGGECLVRPGGKERASECRTAYLEREKARGRALNRIRGIYYKGVAGLIVGVTWSSESAQTWFFNLKKGRFQEAVLLCENGNASVQVVRLPKSFIDQYGCYLSCDKKGMVKFFIQRRGGKLQLQVLDPVGWVDVTSYMDAESLNCPHIQLK